MWFISCASLVLLDVVYACVSSLSNAARNAFEMQYDDSHCVSSRTACARPHDPLCLHTGSRHPHGAAARGQYIIYTMADEQLAPHVKYSLAKYVDKGEDAWVQQPALECTLAGASGAACGKQILFTASCASLPLIQLRTRQCFTHACIFGEAAARAPHKAALPALGLFGHGLSGGMSTMQRPSRSASSVSSTATAASRRPCTPRAICTRTCRPHWLTPLAKQRRMVPPTPPAAMVTAAQRRQQRRPRRRAPH